MSRPTGYFKFHGQDRHVQDVQEFFFFNEESYEATKQEALEHFHRMLAGSLCEWLHGHLLPVARKRLRCPYRT